MKNVTEIYKTFNEKPNIFDDLFNIPQKIFTHLEKICCQAFLSLVWYTIGILGAHSSVG